MGASTTEYTRHTLVMLHHAPHGNPMSDDRNHLVRYLYNNLTTTLGRLRVWTEGQCGNLCEAGALNRA